MLRNSLSETPDSMSAGIIRFSTIGALDGWKASQASERQKSSLLLGMPRVGDQYDGAIPSDERFGNGGQFCSPA
jgi:hypothetical protein